MEVNESWSQLLSLRLWLSAVDPLDTMLTMRRPCLLRNTKAGTTPGTTALPVTVLSDPRPRACTGTQTATTRLTSTSPWALHPIWLLSITRTATMDTVTRNTQAALSHQLAHHILEAWRPPKVITTRTTPQAHRVSHRNQSRQICTAPQDSQDLAQRVLCQICISLHTCTIIVKHIHTTLTDRIKMGTESMISTMMRMTMRPRWLGFGSIRQ